MKRTNSVAALIMALALILSCLAGCDLGGKSEETTDPVEDLTSAHEQDVTTAEPDETTVADETEKTEETTAVVSTVPEVTTAPDVTTAEIQAVTEPQHTHSFSSVWSQSETQHWHECSCEAKTDIALHTFGDWSVTKAPTETTTGEKVRICTVCGYKDIAVVPELSHTHSFASTWASDERSHWHPCICGEKFGTADHTYGEWVVITEATCISVGSIRSTCTVCGFVETATVDKTAHTVVSDPMIPASCTAEGKTEGSHCSYCGIVIVKQSPIPATGHSFSSAWSSDGVNHWHECHCGERKDITPHTVVIDAAVSVTCTAPGKTEGSHCSVCNAIIVAQQTIPAAGHSYVDWVVTKEPTESEEGSKERTCKVCGHKESQVIPKLPPDNSAKDITSSVKVSTAIEMYNGKLPVIRSDAQFIPSSSYLNSISDPNWSTPGGGTRTITIDGVTGWYNYFNDDFLVSIDGNYALFNYPCLWSVIPLKYSFTVEQDGIYEFVIVGAAQIKEEDVGNNAKDRGFCISVDGGKKQQVNMSDTLATFREYTYTYNMSEEIASQIKTPNGINSLHYQMSYTYNIMIPLTKGEHFFEFWSLEYLSDGDLSAPNNSRINFAGAYIQLAK